MFIDYLLERFSIDVEKTFMIWKEKSFSYCWLLERIKYWEEELKKYISRDFKKYNKFILYLYGFNSKMKKWKNFLIDSTD